MAATARSAPHAHSIVPLRLLSDRALLERARRGSEAAVTAIFGRHHQGLYRYALSILASPDDARDAVQNTMVSLLAGLPAEKRDLELKPWLYRIAHNESVSIIRRRREAPLDRAPEPGREADHEARRLTRQLLSDFAELPDQQRTALVLRELNGLSHAEIAETLAISEAAAKQTVYAARKALQELERGREMTCESAERQISDGDRRRLRGRALRAHLSGCAECRAFEQAIRSRSHQLAGLAPLPAALSAQILGGLFGSGIGPGGGAIAGSGGIAVSSAAPKLASLAVAISAAGAGIGLSEWAADERKPPEERAGAPSPSGAGEAGSVGAGAATLVTRRQGSGQRDGTKRSGGQRSSANRGAGRETAGRSDRGGSGRREDDRRNSPSPSGGPSPGQGPAATPAAGASPPGLAGTTPGQAATAPGQSGATPGQTSAAPPGQSGVAPGLAGTAPGAAETTPGKSAVSVAAPPPRAATPEMPKGDR
jgi:RNA polymerase sigma factor (sigma-70 family)